VEGEGYVAILLEPHGTKNEVYSKAKLLFSGLTSIVWKHRSVRNIKKKLLHKIELEIEGPWLISDVITLAACMALFTQYPALGALIISVGLAGILAPRGAKKLKRWRAARQKIVVFVPAPIDATEAQLALLLDRVDAKVVAYLKRAGQVEAEKDGFKISCRGRRLYSPTLNGFVFETFFRRPQKIVVLHFEGHDPFTLD
jgi:hypothetical protein